MNKTAFVFGGSGYIGKFLIGDLLQGSRFDFVYNLDLVDPGIQHGKYRYVQTDVRKPIGLKPEAFDRENSWIFNLAALCREPGSEPWEYFDTNVKGAETVCRFAEETGCRNVFFTSTMSSYGYMPEPTPEHAPQYPETPYGISKLVAEKIHQTWLAGKAERRLFVCRPSVIFGPRDVGNVKRMIKAIKKGYFFFPGDPHIIKAYGYIYDLIRSIHFVLDLGEKRYLVYNFAQDPLHDLHGMVGAIKKLLGKNGFTPRIPIPLLVPLAHVSQFLAGLAGKNSPIHPVRVKKAAYPTHITPRFLLDNGFKFEFTFETALEHWKKECEEDF